MLLYCALSIINNFFLTNDTYRRCLLVYDTTKSFNRYNDHIQSLAGSQRSGNRQGSINRNEKHIRHEEKDIFQRHDIDPNDDVSQKSDSLLDYVQSKAGEFGATNVSDTTIFGDLATTSITMGGDIQPNGQSKCVNGSESSRTDKSSIDGENENVRLKTEDDHFMEDEGFSRRYSLPPNIRKVSRRNAGGLMRFENVTLRDTSEVPTANLKITSPQLVLKCIPCPASISYVSTLK